MPENHPQKLLIVDVSRRLRLPYNTIYRAVASGKVPAERGPGNSRWLIDESDLPALAERLGVPVEGY